MAEDNHDPLNRKKALAQAFLDASTQFTFPLNVHQFLRLGDQWFDLGFKQMLGHRATKLYREMFGEKPPQASARGCGRNLVSVYPRGILEDAWAQLNEELGPDIEPVQDRAISQGPAERGACREAAHGVGVGTVQRIRAALKAQMVA